MFGLRSLLGAAAALGALAVVPASAGAVTPHNPILFVHGYQSSGSVWNTQVANFTRDGWTAPGELNTISYSSNQSNATIAEQLRDRVNAILASTGNSKVDIVSHSMGGLSSRYYIRNLGGTATVDDWVSLGGPNHGTSTANLCPGQACVEMRPGSAFLSALNAGDETPGAVTYGTWRSPCDGVINPSSSTSLTGATNTQTACISHSALTTDSTVYAQEREFVR